MLITQWIFLAIGHLHAWQGKSPIQDSPGNDDPDRLTDAQFVAYLVTSVGLVIMAGLMSGLTLGLMSLDEVDLEVLKRSGTSRQKAAAQRIIPVVADPHRLLVTLLVCNALAAEALPLFLDRLTDPITAVLVSVTVVLLFGEIIPQAACSAYGLEIGASSAPFVRALMLITAPVSVPIGWVLDRVLGSRHTALFRRGELKALVDIHGQGQAFGGQLSSDEVQIIKGALDLTHKRAKTAMTPLDMVFMLPLDAVLDEATMTALLASGHSRIPIHRTGDRSEIVGILLVKELILVDLNAGTKVSEMKVRSLPHLLAETPLYDMLKLFELGRSHMAVLTQPTREALTARRAAEDAIAIDLYSISDDDDDDDNEWTGENKFLHRMESARNRRDADTSSTSSETSGNSGPSVDVFALNFQPHELIPVGIITIEDVLEELLGAEIVDETDQYIDNLHSMRVNAAMLTRSLPAHLRRAVAAWTVTPRVGPALQVYRMGGHGSLRRSRQEYEEDRGVTMNAENLARGRAAVGAVGREDGPAKEKATTPPTAPSVGLRSARRAGKSPHRRTTHMTQGVQHQLDLLQPLLDAQRDRLAAAGQRLRELGTDQSPDLPDLGAGQTTSHRENNA